MGQGSCYMKQITRLSVNLLTSRMMNCYIQVVLNDYWFLFSFLWKFYLKIGKWGGNDGWKWHKYEKMRGFMHDWWNSLTLSFKNPLSLHRILKVAVW